MPELRGSNDDRIDATQPEEFSIQKLHLQIPSEYDYRICKNTVKPSSFCGVSSLGDYMNLLPILHSDFYKLILLITTQDQNVPDLLNAQLRLYDAPNIEELI